MVKRTVKATRSGASVITRKKNSSRKAVPKRLKKQLANDVSHLKNAKIAMLNSTPRKRKKNSLEANMEVPELKLQNNTEKNEMKFNKSKLKIADAELNSDKIINQLNSDETQTILKPKLRKGRPKSVLKAKRTRKQNKAHPVNSAVTKHTQESKKTQVEVTQKPTRKRKKPVYKIKLKTALNLKNSEIESINIQENIINSNKSSVDEIMDMTKIKVEEESELTKCPTADRTVQKPKKKIQRVTKMDKKEIKRRKFYKFTLNNTEGEVRVNDEGIKPNDTHQAELPKPKKYKRIIPNRKSISKTKLKDKCVVKIKKAKLCKKIAELTKKPSTSNTSNSISSLKNSSAEEATPISICSIDSGLDRSEKNADNYIDSKNLNKYNHNFVQKDTVNKSPRIQDNVSDQIAELTQDEDESDGEKVVRKRKKHGHTARRLAKNCVEEIGKGKQKQMSSVEEAINNVVKLYSELPGRSCTVMTSNIHIVKEIVDSKYPSNLDKIIDYVVNDYSKSPESNCKKEKTNETYTGCIVNNTKDSKSKKTRSLHIGETKSHERKRYSRKKNVEQKYKKKKEPKLNLKALFQLKTPVVALKNIMFDEYTVKKYNLTNVRRRCKSSSTNVNSIVNPSPSSSNIVSPPVNRSIPSENVSPLRIITPSTEPTSPVSPKKNIINIQITRNFGTNDATIRCVPLSVSKVPYEENMELESSEESIDEESRYDFSFVSDTGWFEFFPLNNIISIQSHDIIFNSSEFSFSYNKEVAEEDKISKNNPIKKLILPMIVRTVDNNYVNKGNCSTYDGVIPHSNNTELDSNETNRNKTPAFVDSEILHCNQPDLNMSAHSSRLSDPSNQMSNMKNVNTKVGDANIPLHDKNKTFQKPCVSNKSIEGGGEANVDSASISIQAASDSSDSSSTSSSDSSSSSSDSSSTSSDSSSTNSNASSNQTLRIKPKTTEQLQTDKSLQEKENNGSGHQTSIEPVTIRSNDLNPVSTSSSKDIDLPDGSHKTVSSTKNVNNKTTTICDLGISILNGSANVASSKSENLEFKIPLLPRAKRPPRFNKFSSRSWVPKDDKPKTSAPKDDDVDDTISLTVSSIPGDELAQDDIFTDIRDPIPFEENGIFEEVEQDVPNEFCRNIETFLPPILDSELGPYSSPRISSHSAHSNSNNNLENDINTWMATADNDFTSPSQEKQAVSIPAIFRNLCHYQFLKNGCLYRNTCMKIHDAKAVGEAIMNLSYKELNNAYSYAKGRYKLYLAMFSFFVKAFDKFKCTDQLMNMVNDILHTESYNKTPCIAEIVTALCNIGVPFIDAIEEIFLSGDSEKVDSLADMLLEIVCIQHKKHLYNNWCIIQQLIKHRTESLDHGLVDEIMTTCFHAKDIKLAVNVVNDVILARLIDLEAINVHTLNSFLSILESHDVKEGKILRKEMESLAILAIPKVMPDVRLNPISTKSPVNVNRELMPQNITPIWNNSSDCIENNINPPSGSQPLTNHSESDRHTNPLLHNNKEFTPPNVTPINNNSPDCRENNINRPSGSQNSSKSSGIQMLSKPHTSVQDNRKFTPPDITSIHKSSDFIENNANQPAGSQPCSNRSESGSYNNIDEYAPEQTISSTHFGTNSLLPHPTISINNNTGAQENFDLNDIHRSSFSNVLPEDAPPSNSGNSVTNSIKSQNLNGNITDIFEFHRNNEFNFTEEADNLSTTKSVHSLSLHTLHYGGHLQDTELLFLKEVIDEGNYLEFLKMLRKYKDPDVIRAFILNSLVYLKTKSSVDIYEMFIPIATEHIVEYYSKEEGDLSTALLTLMANILGILESRQEYNLASKIILPLSGLYDKLCLPDCTWYMELHRYDYSQVGKYIYLCKILVQSHNLKKAWKLLKTPELKLLYGINKWTLQHSGNFDNKLRNYVVDDLIRCAIDMDMRFALHVILFIVKENNIITEVEIWERFNRVLLKMCDKIEYKMDIKKLITNILEGWYRQFYRPVMRTLLVCLALDLSENVALQLFEKCCNQKCYPSVKGDETCLYFSTNMVEIEIYMMFHAYFHKKVRNNFPLSNLMLVIQLPEPQRQESQLISHSHVTIPNLKYKIVDVLANSLPCTVCINFTDTEENHLLVSKAELQGIYEHYRKSMK